MRWTLDDGRRVGFHDPRRFGRVRLLPAMQARSHPEVKKLGPDAYLLLEREGGPGLWARLRTTRTPIKVALMDQTLLAGLGNIYASEGLFRAKVAPRRPAQRVTKPEAARLALGLLEAMQESLRLEAGDEVKYLQDSDSENHFLVYGREGEPCPVCKKKIKRTVQGGRSTFHCPGCQRR
jgi:formamidopyrimidine-DNA glycosylase